MNRFHVPQFIDVEDKIFGPLTLKQFIYLLGGGAIAFILWALLPRFLAIIFGVPVIGFALALAFYKVNGQPFLTVVAHAVQYFLRSRLYIWKHERKRKNPQKNLRAQKPEQQMNIPATSRGRLHDLAWSLDVQENIETKGTQRKTRENNSKNT